MSTPGRRRLRAGTPLQGLACLLSWSNDSLDAVASNSTLIDIGPGQVVARAGERSQPFVIVVAGELVVETGGAVDRLLQPGDLWGADPLLGAGPAPETLLTLTHARLALAQHGEFQRLFHICPSFAMAVARDLALRVGAPAAS